MFFKNSDIPTSVIELYSKNYITAIQNYSATNCLMKYYVYITAAGAYVTLTVKPPGGDLYPPTPTMPSVGFLGGNGGRPHHHLSTERVTAPLPVNVSIKLAFTNYLLRHRWYLKFISF